MDFRPFLVSSFSPFQQQQQQQRMNLFESFQFLGRSDFSFQNISIRHPLTYATVADRIGSDQTGLPFFVDVTSESSVFILSNGLPRENMSM